jgi:hypothetical protein
MKIEPGYDSPRVSGGRWKSVAMASEGETFFPDDWTDAHVNRQTFHGARWLSAGTIWEPTNLWVTEGESILVTYHNYYLPGPNNTKPPIHEVLWRVNPVHGWYGAEGTGGPAPAGYALPGAREGSLVWKIGPSGPSLTWGTAQVVKQSGEIYVISNDDLGSIYGNGYGDNQGRIHVQVYKA